MIRLELTDQDISDIAEALDDPAISEKNKTKLLVIRMHHERAKHGFITKVLNLHSNTVTNHLKEYSKGGLAGTLEDRYYRPTSSVEPFLACLKCSFLVAPVADAKQAVVRIESLTGVRLSESQARRFMKGLGMKIRTARNLLLAERSRKPGFGGIHGGERGLILWDSSKLRTSVAIPELGNRHHQ